jgi:hypothetical protein
VRTETQRDSGDRDSEAPILGLTPVNDKENGCF